ncbi:glycosyltransferase 87 family protein [Catenuloplanes indicus]|uniref:DUF2029 domain-containing protein n=1 Tax=Catenuloplanes indicus TaxID=137267 RepID=A0AAE3VVM9_9ACTN|nr:glycosyltransferase 87 family protein [Catenuloplanes indicus]MDQ0363805.1 hypothetical protein [Catenuloplanes indicus]
MSRTAATVRPVPIPSPIRGLDRFRRARPVAWRTAGYTIAAVFATGVGAFAGQEVQASWGRWAAGGYVLAALVTSLWRHTAAPFTATAVALAGAVVAPLVWMVTGGRGMSTVGMGPLTVIKRAGRLLLESGSPYLTMDRLTGPESLNPYGPPLAVFGLPHALGLDGWAGNPRTWFVLSAVLLGYAALRRVHADRPLWRLAAAFASPVLALPVVLGSTDLPVLGLLALGIALLSRALPHHPPAGTATGRPGDRPTAAVPGPVAGPAPGLPDRPPTTAAPGPQADRAATSLDTLILAGAALGVACAMKATALPAALVLIPLLLARAGWRPALTFATSGALVAVASAALTAPAMLADSRDLVHNVVMFPLRLTAQQTTAASPMPGQVVAADGSGGRLLMIGLLAAAMAAAVAYLWRRPARTAPAAVMQMAVIWSLIFTLAPSTRYGYFVYPLLMLGLRNMFRDRGPSREQRDEPRPAHATSIASISA